MHAQMLNRLLNVSKVHKLRPSFCQTAIVLMRIMEDGFGERVHSGSNLSHYTVPHCQPVGRENWKFHRK